MFARPARRRPPRAALGALSLLALLALACSPRLLMVNALGNALSSGSSSSFASDPDPVFVGDAVPFALKTMESLLESSPRHRGLLLATSSGFAQYAYVWVQSEADYAETERGDLAFATAERRRAKALYLRARDYGLRGLELRRPGLAAVLRARPEEAASVLGFARREDVPFLYWTATGWGAAITLDKTDSQLSLDLPIVGAMMQRALELDESYDRGALHELLAVFEGNRSAIGGSVERAREHYARALELSRGARVSTFVGMAENVAIPVQDRATFREALEKALAVDIEAEPGRRLANVIGQRRARWLLQRVDELFIE